MKVITRQSELSVDDIAKVLANRHGAVSRILKLKEYYNGRHAILRKPPRKFDAPNNRIVANFPRYIVNISANFFLGKPVTYKVAAGKEEELATLLDIFRYNDESSHNVNLATEMSAVGEAYEILYTDSDANIRFCQVPAEEMTLVCDSTLEENPICAIRLYRVNSLDNSTYDEYVDVYTDKRIEHYTYNYNVLKGIGVEEHYFGDVPAIEYLNNRERRGDFEDVISLVDAYNMAQSLTLDDLTDFTDAFLILRNFLGTDGNDIRRMRQDKTLLLDNDGDASWLIKNINDTYVENVKTRLQNDIHKFSSVPDMSDEKFTGNASGVAIKYKLMGLEQVRSRKEREFKRGLQRRIEIISNILRLKNMKWIDFRDVDMIFSANIPANVTEQAQIANQLDGLVSRETLIGLLPFVESPEMEAEKLRREQGLEYSEH